MLFIKGEIPFYDPDNGFGYSAKASTAIKKLVKSCVAGSLKSGLGSSGNYQAQNYALIACGSLGRGDWTLSSDFDFAIIHNPKPTKSDYEVFEIIKNSLLRGLPDNIQVQLVSLNIRSLSDLVDSGIYSFFSLLDGETVLGFPQFLKEALSTIGGLNGVKSECFNFLRNSISERKLFIPEKPDVKECLGGIRHIQNALRIIYLDRIIADKNLGYDNFNVYRFLNKLVEWKFLGQTDAYFIERTYLLALNWRNYLECRNKDSINDVYRDFAVLCKLENSGEVVRVLTSSFGVTAEILDKTLSGYAPRLRCVTYGKYTYRCDAYNRKIYNIERYDKKRLDLKPVEMVMQTLTFLAEKNYVLNTLTEQMIQKTVHENAVEFRLFSDKHKGEHLYKIFLSANTMPAMKWAFGLFLPNGDEVMPRSLADWLIPGLDRTRAMITEPEFHDTTLDVHSYDSLKNCEEMLVQMKDRFREEFKQLDTYDIFALKICAFLHDIGKVEYRPGHEKIGADRVARLLKKLGLLNKNRNEELIRFLIFNHQEPEKILRTSEYPEDIPISFVKLCDGDGKKMFLLYMLCSCDMKAVSSAFKSKVRVLEDMYLQCINQLRIDESEKFLKDVQGRNDKTLSRLVENYLYARLYNESLNGGLPEFIPTSVKDKGNIYGADKSLQLLGRIVETHVNGESRGETMQKEKLKFISELKKLVTGSEMREKYNTEYENALWFFAVFPNRMLLRTSLFGLTYLVDRFCNGLQSEATFEFVSSGLKQPPRLLFHSYKSNQNPIKLSYYLGLSGLDIESGKINTIVYRDGKEGFAGYFDLLQEPGDALKTAFGSSLYTSESKFLLPRQKETVLPESIELEILPHNNRAYEIRTSEHGVYHRFTKNCTAIHLSMPNARFALFKILLAFDKFDCRIFQIRISTYGEKIYDTFYLEAENFDLNALHMELGNVFSGNPTTLVFGNSTEYASNRI